MSRRSNIRMAMASVIVAFTLTPSARANIVAAVEQPAGGARTDLDIALYDATTGPRLGLPSSVNTTDDELHPSLTPDGRLLVFERRNPLGGSIRIVIVELATGKTADLFSGFEVSQVPPTSPAVTPDGKTVITGRPAPPGSSFVQTVTLTDVSSFAADTTGPFPHSDFALGQNGGAGGEVFEPTVGAGGLLAFEPRVPQLQPEISVGMLGVTGLCGLADPEADLSQPALSAASSQYMLLVRRNLPGGAPHPGDIWFATLHPEDRLCKASFGAALPGLVNTSDDESRPALTPDGRYVGFVRHSSGDQHSRLFIWDSLTQLMVNAQGIDLGVLSPREIDLIVQRGNLSLRIANVLRLATISLSGVVSAQLLASASVGILVQRVIGHTRLLGRRVPRLRLIGRVPLGHFRRGRAHVRWDRKVNGVRLRAGLYQITVRALARNGRIADLGDPRLVRIP